MSGTTFNVGHAFVAFTKVNSDGTSVTQVMGFYPGARSSNTKGVIKDDSGHPFDVSYTVNVDSDHFNYALNALVSDNDNKNYVLTDHNFSNSEYNCTDAALTWMAAGDAAGQIPGNASRGLFVNTPGDYGQDLRNVSGANTIGGNAVSGNGPCN